MVNDYPLDSYYNQWKDGLTPSQQLWGKVELDKEEGIELIILPHQKYRFLNKLGNIINIQHFDQQVRALLIKNEIDIIYAPFAAATTKFLLILKLLGLLKTPIVAMIHYPLLGSNSQNKIIKLLGKKLMMGFDRMLFISQNIKSDNIRSFSLSPKEYEKRYVHLNWGAETTFYNKVDPRDNEEREDYFISSGQTNRDFDTLIEAFRHLDFKLKIYAKPNYEPRSKNIPENVEIYTKRISSREIIELYKNSLAVLICFKITQKSTLGITVLLDAMAIGKPVIITENSYIDIDVEKEGIGYWVGEGHVQDWVSKIKKLIDCPETVKKMGQKAFDLHINKYNMDNFGKSLKNVLLDLSEEMKK
jgi:glycosyltransferase involved in cell wall biosynthesis